MTSLPRLIVCACLAGVLTARLALAAAPAPRIEPARIDAVFKDYGRSTPGCALGVSSGGRLVYAKGYGMADLTFGVPITPATVFDIGSTSKQFAAASLLLLAADGKVALSDDVRKYVPELPDYGDTITLEHLLQNTSGLGDYTRTLWLKGFKMEDATDDDDALAVIVKQRALLFKPGAQWAYSNTGFFLLSVVIKRVTGKTLAEFAKERLFMPLGLARTHFRDDHTSIVPGRATAYSPREKGGGFQTDLSDWDQLGDGAVNTNVTELLQWEENFYTARVGGTALVEQLQRPATLTSGESVGYARGLFLDTYRGQRRIHHSGGWAGYRAVLMRFPEQHLSIAVLCNRGDARPQEQAEAVADVVLGQVLRAPERGFAAAPLASATPSIPAEPYGEVKQFAGCYFSEEFQNVLRLKEQGGKLSLVIGIRSLPLRPTGPGRFDAEGGRRGLELAGDQLKLEAPLGGPPYTFRRIGPVDPPAVNWEPLLGAYDSPDLQTSLRITMKDGKAVLKGRTVDSYPLEPAFADAFTAGPMFLRVTRDAGGQAAGFELSASGMKRIRFERR